MHCSRRASSSYAAPYRVPAAHMSRAVENLRSGRRLAQREQPITSPLFTARRTPASVVDTIRGARDSHDERRMLLMTSCYRSFGEAKSRRLPRRMRAALFSRSRRPHRSHLA
jgi:hypothetical protein